jgi:hypothetical protein
MRSILFLLAILFAAAPACAQESNGSMRAGVTILAPDRVELGQATQLVRGADGDIRLTAPLRLTHQVKPVMAVQNENGAACSLAPIGAARGDAGAWETRLRCTTPAPARAATDGNTPMRVRLLTYNN